MISRALTLTLTVTFLASVVVGENERAGLRASSQPIGSEAGVIDFAHRSAGNKLIDGGVKYLLSHGDEDGGWSIGGANRPAITAMVLKALLQHPDSIDVRVAKGTGLSESSPQSLPAGRHGQGHPPRADCIGNTKINNSRSPRVRKGFDVMLSYRQSNGGIYDPRTGLANYSTALAVMAMVAADDARFDDVIREGVAFLRGQQIIPGSVSPDGSAIDDNHPFTGGVSYGRDGRPDLSNVGMWMQAMHDAGVSGDDPALQNALRFVARVQNRSESNPSLWAQGGGDDGGFVYAPALGEKLGQGESKAGPGPGGRGLRSYGSMTYVGFKSMLYADVDRDDPRVGAAFQWIRRHWRLDSNPNMPSIRSHQGLYYYYHVFAKALRAWGQPTITDSAGVKHNWREELIDELARRVRPDGSWVNQADRWHEGSAILVTTYSVLALEESLMK